MEDLCKKQAEIIKLLTDAILINSKQEYIKSIKHICIAIITSFTILMWDPKPSKPSKPTKVSKQQKKEGK